MAEDGTTRTSFHLENNANPTKQDGGHVVLSDGMIVEPLVDNLCTLRLCGETIPLITPRTISSMRRSGIPCLQQGGVLLDVQAVNHLSIVRLASFLDSISPMASLIAVLFRDADQCKLARLLHNTMINKESIAYFTDPRAAFMFLALAV